MQCFEASSLLFSLTWSAAMLTLVIKLDRANGFDSGLKDLFSTPIVSSLAITCIYVYITYEALSAPTNETIVSLLQRINNFIETSTCAFVSILNNWGLMLLIISFYKLAKKYFPQQINSLKEKLKSMFGGEF
jgi:hypothetical protein